MKKKLLSVLLATVLLLTCIPLGAVSAEEYYTEGDYEYTVSDGEATIEYYTGSGGAITIPATLGGYPVTTIGEFAFSDCTSLTSVTIGNSVTTIGKYAFEYCTNLTSVTIPDSVTTIGSQAFWECTSLTAIAVDENNVNYCSADGVLFNKDKTMLVQYPGGKSGAYSIPDSVTTIGGEAFRDCTSLESVVIPDSVTTICDSAFIFCTSLTSVTIGNSVTTIGKHAFYECTSLTKVHITDLAAWCGIDFGNYSANPLYYAKNLYLNNELVTELVIPDSVTTIGYYAFSNCTSLTSLTIPDSVTTIGEEAFSRCTSLTSVTIPDSVTTIGDLAFDFCTSLTSVTIPDSVTAIGIWTFAYCTSLTSVTIPDSVTTIGDGAFSDCTSLTSVTIPDSVTTIGDLAFYGCTSLTAIEVDKKNANYSSMDGVLFNKDKTTIVQYPCGKKGAYSIPDSVTTIGGRAFYECTSLTSVTIGDSVTTIVEGAFYDCTSLTSVTIPDSVTTIGDLAFGYCTSLTDVYYTGTKAQADTISIGYNTYLTNATWHYNYIPPCKTHTYASATCTKAKTCKVCGATSGSKLGHSYNKVVTKATATKNGTIKNVCTRCNYTASKVTTIYKASKISLSKTSFTYDGKVKKPTLTVKDSAGNTISSSNYTVKYASGCKNAGTYKVTVTFKGNYSGTKTLTYKINPIDISKCTVSLSATSYTYNGSVKKPTVTVKNANGTKLTTSSYTVTYASGRKNVGTYKVTVKMKGNYTGTKTLTFKINPAKTTVSKLTAGSKKLTVAITKKTTQVTGYQVQYSTSKSFSSYKTKTLTSYKTTSATLTGLKAKTTYYVRVRTYKTVNGVKYYSGWSTVKYLKTK